MHAKFAIYISVKDVKDQIFLVFGKDQLFLVRPKIMGRTKKGTLSRVQVYKSKSISLSDPGGS